MLYFVRHGQTDHNIKKLYAGRVDIPLNETGLKQINEAAIQSKNIKIDIIFCSPLKRAIQTCEAINEYHHSPVIISENIIERSFGRYESKTFSSLNKEECWNYFLDFDKGGVETPKMVFGRVYELLDEIREKYFNKNVLIISHNGIGRAIHCYFNGIPKDGNIFDITAPNATIIEYDFDLLK